MYEVEQKFRLLVPELFLEKIAALGVTWAATVEEIDIYFQHPCRDFSKTDEAFRIRRRVTFSETDDSQNSPIFESCITFKGKRLETETKTRREIELPLAFSADAPENIRSLEDLTLATRAWEILLAELGFRAVFPVKKTRRKAWLFWENIRVEISYDDVPPTGKWAELEILVPTLEELPAAERIIRTLAGKLGLTEVEKRSYLELVMEGMQK